MRASHPVEAPSRRKAAFGISCCPWIAVKTGAHCSGLVATPHTAAPGSPDNAGHGPGYCGRWKTGAASWHSADSQHTPQRLHGSPCAGFIAADARRTLTAAPIGLVTLYGRAK